MKRTTIQDVAKEAGVSITTVSRVINKNYPVKEATRKKVEEAIESLGFAPNLLARSLIQNSTKTVGILTPSLENLFFSEVIKGIDTIMRDYGYTTFLCHTEGEPENEVEMIQSLMNRQVDGIVMIDPRKENVVSGYFENLSKKVPLLLINGHFKGVQCNYVLNDAQTGVSEALKYFEEKGSDRIAFLRGKRSYSYDIKEEVYSDFVKARDLTENIIRIKDGNDVKTVEQAKEATMKVLQGSNPPNAILACNDWMGVGAINGVKALGLRIPEDVRVIGFDNTIISQIIEPKLSTVDQQMTKLGQLAATRIYKMMTRDDAGVQKIYLETKLVIRES